MPGGAADREVRRGWPGGILTVMAYKEKYPSVLLEEAVDAISSLPGVGRKGALRLALHLLKQHRRMYAISLRP